VGAERLTYFFRIFSMDLVHGEFIDQLVQVADL